MPLALVTPAPPYLPGYLDALHRGWSPDNVRGDAARLDELGRIDRDPDAFLASLVDREARGGPLRMPDGSERARLPGYRKWMWDDAFVGTIGFRWQPGTEALPSHVLGHIGYSVVPWKRGRGYAKAALRQMLVHARDEGLSHVEITTDLDNHASRRVIEANGGVLVERFTKPAQYGNREGLRFRVATPIG